MDTSPIIEAINRAMKVAERLSTLNQEITECQATLTEIQQVQLLPGGESFVTRLGETMIVFRDGRINAIAKIEFLQGILDNLEN